MKKLISFLCILTMLFLSLQPAFAVQKDTTPPKVLQTDPGNNGTGVEINKTITVRFSEKVVKGSTFSRIKLSDPSKTPVRISVTVEKNNLIIKAVEDFDYDTGYVLTIPANAVKDSSGNGLKKAFTLRFNTQPKPSSQVVSVFQNGKEVKLDDSDDMIHIDRNTFSLRFHIPIEGVVQLAALDNSDDYDLTEEGTQLEDIPYFIPGTGMAADGKYDSLYINNEGHHYLFYSDDSDSRLSLLFEDQNSIIDAEWQINALQILDTDTYEFNKYSFKDFPSDVIYLVVVNDINNDGIIDDGEYTKLVLTFN